MTTKYPITIEMVQTPEGLLVGKYAVTLAQWCAVMGGDPGEKPLAAASGMTQAQAIEFCRLLSEAEGRTGDDAYRLPTKDEWSYAAHAGSSTLFGIFTRPLSDYAWYGRPNHKGQPATVGKKLPNAWGIYDMYGNVHEMTQHVNMGYVLLAGGSFRSTELQCSVGNGLAKKSHADDVGFRVFAGVRTPPPAEKEKTFAYGVKDYTDLDGW